MSVTSTGHHHRIWYPSVLYAACFVTVVVWDAGWRFFGEGRFGHLDLALHYFAVPFALCAALILGLGVWRPDAFQPSPISTAIVGMAMPVVSIGAVWLFYVFVAFVQFVSFYGHF